MVINYFNLESIDVDTLKHDAPKVIKPMGGHTDGLSKLNYDFKGH